MNEQIKFFSGDTELSGELHVARSDFDKPDFLVFILTGDGPKGTTSKTWGPVKTLFESEGISYFIFDFLSQGLSAGNRSDLTLDMGIKNFEAAVKFIKGRRNLDRKKFGVFGSSFGASVALGFSEIFDEIEFYMFKSPASVLYEAYEHELQNDFSSVANWLEKGSSETLGLSKSAYESALEHNLYKNARKIKCPALIVHGDADTIVPINQSRRLNSIMENSTLIELKGVNHGYKEEGASERLHTSMKNFLRNLG